MDNYFDESYQSKNSRWNIDIKKENGHITVCIWNNSLTSSKYCSQYCININKYGFDGNYLSLPKYLQKELKNIQVRYFK